MCTTVASNFAIAGNLLGEKILADLGGKHTYHATEKGYIKIPYIPLYSVFPSLHNSSDLSLLSLPATRVCHKLFYFPTHASRGRRGQGRVYENLQEAFNSGRKVYQGLVVKAHSAHFALILSLLSFPSELWCNQ